MTEITAKKKDSEKSVKVSYDMPETLDALVEKFGAEAVAGAATDSFTISIQSVIRRNFDKSQEEIEAAVAAWLPGVRQAGDRLGEHVDPGGQGLAVAAGVAQALGIARRLDAHGEPIAVHDFPHLHRRQVDGG